jgi:phospholipid transport system substrate-binding protein
MHMRIYPNVLAVLAAALIAVPIHAGAADPAGPEELVRKITADVLEAVKTDKQLAAGDRKKALALAEQKILPYVDFREAAMLAVGKAWYAATPAQQKIIVDEFREMLVRIYSNAVDVYRGQTMRVLPLRIPADATEVTVRNQYLSEGRPPVPVSYEMRKTPQGWKIYDISIEGVSMVLTYRSEFEQITRASGIDGLIKRLQQKNA